uniref:Uncharacterized protein n=1 Tax=Macrostomum lignano TaxID=282301 RepID=A0A1I8FKW9_9PLAT
MGKWRQAAPVRPALLCTPTRCSQPQPVCLLPPRRRCCPGLDCGPATTTTNDEQARISGAATTRRAVGLFNEISGQTAAAAISCRHRRRCRVAVVDGQRLRRREEAPRGGSGGGRGQFIGGS